MVSHMVEYEQQLREEVLLNIERLQEGGEDGDGFEAVEEMQVGRHVQQAAPAVAPPAAILGSQAAFSVRAPQTLGASRCAAAAPSRVPALQLALDGDAAYEVEATGAQATLENAQVEQVPCRDLPCSAVTSLAPSRTHIDPPPPCIAAVLHSSVAGDGLGFCYV